MRRFLRLLTLWLIALALPLHGAQAATAMAGHAGAPSHQLMVMPDGTTMDAVDMPAMTDAGPCHGHALAQSGCCGDCCGPIAAQHEMLDVVPVAARWATLLRDAAEAASPQFLTGGTDRPPRSLLA
ncbi:MAG TPA: hypothetical protein VES00_13485 [Burkholderiaceae bacterium]|jgi:hypothetical protein|nr:hypothetical protein [Burkholderiaceae bacterium]